MPDRLDSQTHEASTQESIENEQQEISLILHSNAVIDPRTVMIHQENAAIASPTMMRPCWLDGLTLLTLSRPKVLKLTYGFLSIS